MKSLTKFLDSFGAIALAIIWIAPLLFAFWAATHSTSDAVNLNLFSPWTLENFRVAWAGAPWLKYFINTFLLVTVILIGQFILTTLAGFAFAQLNFPGKDFVFILVLMQLFILPEVLIVENYAMVSRLELFDSILGVGMPYMASAFGIFLMRQAFKGVPIELHEAARIEGCGLLGILWRVYVPLAKPTYLAYALVSVFDPLEQLFVAPDRHQLTRNPAPDGGPVDLWRAGKRRGYQHHFSRHADVSCPAVDRLSGLPAPIRAGFPENRDQMTTILQISDTHIVPEGALVSGRLDTAEIIGRLVTRLNLVRDRIGPIDALLISGDLTDDGHAESYARLKTLIAPLDLPAYVIPGNHDVREAMRHAFADSLPAAGPLNWTRQIGDIHLIGLDTLVEGQGGGTLSPQSLTFLQETLSKAKAAPVLLALHHPPFESGITFMDEIGLSNLGAFVDIVSVYKGTLRMLCGHIHTMMISDVAGHIAVSAPSPCSTIAYDRRSDAPVGFLTQEDSCLLHRWDDGFQTIRLAPVPGSGPHPF